MRPPPALVLLATLAALLAITLPSLPAGASGPADRARAPGPATSSRTVGATTVVRVRPVTTAGAPAAGWRVHRLTGAVTCDGASPSAVDPGITSCYPTAYGLRACWRSAGHTVLCVRDATVRTLVRVRYQGRYPQVVAPDTAAPAGLALADGRSCLARTGGAWSSPAQHRQWVGFDSCSRRATVYGPGSSVDGIDRGRATWTVRLWRSGPDPAGHHLVLRRVTTAYLVGTAAA